MKVFAEELHRYKDEIHELEGVERYERMKSYKTLRRKDASSKDKIRIKEKHIQPLIAVLQKESEKLKYETDQAKINRKKTADERAAQMGRKMNDISKRQYDYESQMKLSDRDKELEYLRGKVRKYEETSQNLDIMERRNELEERENEVIPITKGKGKPKGKSQSKGKGKGKPKGKDKTEKKPVRDNRRHNKRSQVKRIPDKSPLKEFKKSIKKNTGIMV